MPVKDDGCSCCGGKILLINNGGCCCSCCGGKSAALIDGDKLVALIDGDNVGPVGNGPIEVCVPGGNKLRLILCLLTLPFEFELVAGTY